ncbi:hypothetical protein KDW_53690 [Dictyobacter vulcani]|uniref:4-vinyl reductase 4VR domain-containing protein n=1 Tax=Dictyobacter vulcani TaxID=2607529 RepID=A0A5J4KXE5_9CHLR|nr:hypothetical protein [Dictyobacter vulcani]GER91207.1 hypothetical protein KDW_53690 [Dictyobacter vulcani]
MLFGQGKPSSSKPSDVLKSAQEHVLLIIDTNEVRSQKLASLLTLAGMRAIVTTTSYQAFDRYIKERFWPLAILIGQSEDMTTPLFGRFMQRLRQELQYETPVVELSSFFLSDGLILSAETLVSPTTHIFSQQNSAVLKRIWQLMPSAAISLKQAEKTIVMDTLPKYGFQPRVTRTKRSFSSHLYYQLKAARLVIPAEQWDNLLRDVGLAQYIREENWPPAVDQFTIPPEYFSLLMRAVMYSNPRNPIQQIYHWANQVEADALQKAVLIFFMQQIPKVIGPDLTMRALLNIMTNEIDSRRGEKLTEWKRLQDGSFIFAFYSNIFAYSVIGATQPLCGTWQSSFDLILRLTKQEQQWYIREVECSSQTHTGHCVFQITPTKQK